MADIQAGIGPFLGIFLLAHGWESGLIGTVMTVGGIAGMIMTTPAGAMIDASTRKRAYVVIPGIFTVIASATLLISQSFWVVAASQSRNRHRRGRDRPGRHRNYAGDRASNGLQPAERTQSGFQPCRQCGRRGAVRFSRLEVRLRRRIRSCGGIRCAVDYFGTCIPGKAIDDHIARGASDDPSQLPASAWQVLFECKPLLILAAALALFHLGNAAMLPLYGLAVVSGQKADGPGFVAMTIVVAQAVMIVASIVAMRMAEKQGYWLVLLISFVALPVRGLIAASVIQYWGVFPVQMLDGIGAGLQSVAVPGLVARILNGTGRVNVGQGAVMTVQGIGAALSPAIGGWLAQGLGYPSAFLVLGCFAVGSARITLIPSDFPSPGLASC